MQGSISNTARSNSTAKVNIGSIVGSGKQMLSNNNQQVFINGSVINTASGCSKSEINMGSVVTQD